MLRGHRHLWLGWAVDWHHARIRQRWGCWYPRRMTAPHNWVWMIYTVDTWGWRCLDCRRWRVSRDYLCPACAAKVSKRLTINP